MEIIREKLTKQFLMGLPAGGFLVSNVGYNPMEPIFAEEVVQIPTRENQWTRIKQHRVDQRICNFFKNKKQFEKWLSGKSIDNPD